MSVKATMIVVVALLGIFGIAWAVEGNNFFIYKTFAPKTEQVRRETFEQSKAYVQGNVQELQNMWFEYAKAKPEQQAALASIILHRAADFDENKLPPDLRAFIAGLRSKAAEASP